MSLTKLKDPASEFDYQIDWLFWLGGTVTAPDDTIVTSVWAVDPTGELTIVADNFNPTNTSVQVSGGVARRVYRLINTITTVGGNTVERTITVRGGNR